MFQVRFFGNVHECDTQLTMRHLRLSRRWFISRSSGLWLCILMW